MYILLAQAVLGHGVLSTLWMLQSHKLRPYVGIAVRLRFFFVLPYLASQLYDLLFDFLLIFRQIVH